MAFTSYITKAGDRWDEIAYQYLGDATDVVTLFNANKLVPLRPELDEGIEIFIPIFNPEDVEQVNNLPPWNSNA